MDARILSFIRRHARAAAPEKEFDALAIQLFRYQYERNPYYRRLCKAAGGSPDSVRSWKEIPAMPTAGFKELILTAFPAKQAVRVFRTSGTTREMKGAHFFDTLRLYDAAATLVFERYLMPDTRDLQFYFLTASPTEVPHSSLSYMMGLVNRRFARGRGKFYVKGGELEAQRLLDDLRRANRKVLILSTAFSLKYFLDFLRSRKASLRLRAGSRLMETGGFKGQTKQISRTALYRECRRRLGIEKDLCVSEYGMTELTSQFYDTTLRDRFLGIRRRPFKQGPAWMRTLVIDPRSGRPARRGRAGILRHFDLANRGSVLAVQTEDLGRAVGDGFELLGRLPGSELRGCSLSYEELLGAADEHG